MNIFANILLSWCVLYYITIPLLILVVCFLVFFAMGISVVKNTYVQGTGFFSTEPSEINYSPTEYQTTTIVPVKKYYNYTNKYNKITYEFEGIQYTNLIDAQVQESGITIYINKKNPNEIYLTNPSPGGWKLLGISFGFFFIICLLVRFAVKNPEFFCATNVAASVYSSSSQHFSIAPLFNN